MSANQIITGSYTYSQTRSHTQSFLQGETNAGFDTLFREKMAENQASLKPSPDIGTHVVNGEKTSDCRGLVTDLSGSTNVETKTVNMRNISLNEYNELLKSGFDESLDYWPPLPPIDYIDQYGLGHTADLKVDYMDQIETAIENKKKFGGSIDRLEKTLEAIKKIDGTNWSSWITKS